MRDTKWLLVVGLILLAMISLPSGIQSGLGGGGAGAIAFQVTMAGDTVAMQPGIHADNGVSTVMAGVATITRTAGAESCTFRTFIDHNAGAPVRGCRYSPGCNMANYTVVNFAGATCAAGVAFPADSAATATIDIVAGVWQAPVDLRANLVSSTVDAGLGLTGTGHTLAIDPSVYPYWHLYALVAIANGVNGCANANGCWQINGALGANKAAALTQDVVLFQLPAKGHVTDWRVKTATACTGTATANTGLGTTGDNVLFRAQTYDIQAAAANTNLANGPTAGAGSDTAAATDIVASLVTTVNNVDQLVVGCAADYWALWSVLP